MEEKLVNCIIADEKKFAFWSNAHNLDYRKPNCDLLKKIAKQGTIELLDGIWTDICFKCIWVYISSFLWTDIDYYKILIYFIHNKGGLIMGLTYVDYDENKVQISDAERRDNKIFSDKEKSG